MRRSTPRRTSLVLAAALPLALLAPAAATAAPADEPAPTAAGWLADQLVDGERIETSFGEDTFPDHGLTADVVLALAGAGVARDRIDAATDWLEGEVDAYLGREFGATSAGAAAKLLLVLETAGRPTTVDGENLVATLADREQDSGRFTDEGSDDFSNTITQSLAVLALERVEDDDPSADAVGFLADQACDDGSFPQELTDPDEPAPDPCEGQVDATGFAVQALHAAGGHPAVLADAVGWLTDAQQDDGGFAGPEGTANSNSTGLAAVALDVAGEDAAADDARGFLRELQVDCNDPDPDLTPGAIRFDAADSGDAVRATAQALPGLTGVGLGEVSAAGASPDVPTPDCPMPFPDVAEDSVHAPAVIELARRRVLLGHPDDTFRPADSLTRGQLASVVARAAGLAPGGDAPFSDTDGSVHEGAIAALHDAGVVEGYADGTFRPGTAVRRDQAAALLARWLELDPDDEDAFSDLGATVHRELINALAQIDVARGGTDGRFRPDELVRRDQTASLVLRALDHRDGA